MLVVVLALALVALALAVAIGYVLGRILGLFGL